MGDPAWLEVLPQPQRLVRGEPMVMRPPHFNAYEFVVVSALRAQQLLAGCTPSLPGEHTAATMAQMEVAGGHVARSDGQGVTPPRQCGWQL